LLEDDEADPPPLLEADPLPPLPEVPPVPESEELDDEVDLELPPPAGFRTVVLRSSHAASANAPSRTNINARIFMSSTPCFGLPPDQGKPYAFAQIALCGMTIATRSSDAPAVHASATGSHDPFSVLHGDMPC
jgi:hypothetical protein